MIKFIAFKDGHKVWKDGNEYKLRINNEVNPFYKGLLTTTILKELSVLLKDIRPCMCKACKKNKKSIQ